MDLVNWPYSLSDHELTLTTSPDLDRHSYWYDIQRYNVHHLIFYSVICYRYHRNGTMSTDDNPTTQESKEAGQDVQWHLSFWQLYFLNMFLSIK